MPDTKNININKNITKTIITKSNFWKNENEMAAVATVDSQRSCLAMTSNQGGNMGYGPLSVTWSKGKSTQLTLTFVPSCL